MKIRLYGNLGSYEERTVTYDHARELPEIVYMFVSSANEYKFFRKGNARNSTIYYETEALHVPE